MLKVIGVKKQEGEYNGNPYKNYVIYVVDSDNQTNTVVGLCPSTIKVKQEFLNNICDAKDLYQKEIEVYYNSYGHVAKFEILK